MTTKPKRHIGVRTTEAAEDIATSMQLVQRGFVNDGEFYELFNYERKRLGLTPWTVEKFTSAIIAPARKKAIENQKKVAEQAVIDLKRKKQMLEQQERQVRIKELEQESRIKTLEAEVLDKEKRLKILREEFGIGDIKVELDKHGKRIKK